MSKNIKTQEAKLDLITKFLDYANCADASYAMLQYVFKGIIKYKNDNGNELEKKVDTQRLGDKHNNQNSTYARAIQARFEQNKIVKIEPKYCISLINTCFDSKEITLDNDISRVGLNDALSKRTIDFVNRFKLLKHQPNTTSGFSATLFEDTKDNNQKIIVIRGTEPTSNFSVDILDADVDLALGKVPYNQYLDMIKFYSECVKEFPNIIKDKGLVIVGHSLGGALAQLLTLSLASVNSSANVKEIYTFNSPGAKELKALNLNQIYRIDGKIINSDNKEQALFYQIRSYKYQKSIEINLIGYDSNLFQNIKSYFHNKTNLKEHYIFIKTNIIYSKSTNYFYDIFEVDEVFINCVNQLLTNLNIKNILATSDNTYHIETDTDSDASNTKEVIQDLGVDIDGKHYIVNLGDRFWDSHFLEPTIIELNYILNLMKNKEIDNLLEYNINKDEELWTFIKYHNNVLATARTRYDDRILSYFSIPKLSNDFSNSLEYLQIHYLPKEPKKPLFAANIQGFSSTQLQALEEYKIKKAKYDEKLKWYELYKVKYEREQQIFNQKFKEYFSEIIFYQNRLYSHKKTQEKIILNAIIQQINQKDITYFNLYSVIEFLKENKAYYKYIDLNEIQDLILNDLDNKLGYFYCLYVCINLIVLREDKNTYFTQATAINNLGYNSTFTKIFILDKEKLNDTYLDARKRLYKSINTLKEKRNEKIKDIQDYLNKEISLQDNLNNQSFNTKENDVNLILNEVFNIEQFYDKNTNTIVLKTNNIKIIFLDKVNLQDLQDNSNNTSFISMSNLIHIYDNHCDIFAKDRSVLDIKDIEEKYQIDFKSLDIKIFLNSTLLTGSNELPNNPFYFGELDQDNTIKQDTPSYYFSPKDESSGLGRLSIFYKNDELCLLNYSIIENSLNIKLECLSKQSLEYKDLISNTLKEQKTTQVDKKQAIAKLHALLENQNLECIHGGKVILKSNKGKTFKDDGVPIMLESDLLNSSIVACPNTIAGVSVPCTKVVNVKGSLSQKKVNNEYVILQELISACKTDKGFALKVSFTPTKFKFDHSFDPKEGLGEQSKNQIELKEPIIRLHYKSDRFQKDNLPIYNLLINNEKKEQNKALNEFNIDLKDIEDINILNQFKQDFSKDYEFKELNLSFDTNLIKLYFIIPKNIAKVYKSAYKEFENKDLGVGYFTQLHEYDKIIKNALEDNKELNEYHFSFLAPAKMQNLKLQIAQGLDEILEDEDRKQELYVCKFVVVNGVSENNAQEIIPDNVIRIQTQDGSGEFIEIVFPSQLELNDKPLEDVSYTFVPALRGIKQFFKDTEYLKPRTLTKDEVLQIVDKLPKNVRDKRRRIVENKEELDKLWKKLTKNSEEFENKVDKKYGQPIYMRKLDDQTIIQYKKTSKSGGETIEINSNKPRGNLKTIHIENGIKNEI
ncbi:hypothetical protein ACJ5FQ_001812 [Campylobacter coli]